MTAQNGHVTRYNYNAADPNRRGLLESITDATRTPVPEILGLSFFRNRFYDQETGRWTQEDPIGVAGGHNLYQYAGNNPVSYTDPFGLCPDCILDAAFVAADINDIRKHGWSWGRGLALGVDLLAAAVPLVPAAGGAAMRGLGAVERLRYVPSPKHGTVARGAASAAPRHGQDALDVSLRIKGTSPRRIGIDYDANQFVVFDRTVGSEFHGHVRSWGELTGEMQRTLIDAGMADRRGRILR